MSVLGFLGLYVLELGRDMRQTDRRTDTGRTELPQHIPHFAIASHGKKKPASAIAKPSM